MIEPQTLTRIRLALRLTQREAAAKVGVAPNTWARWERGELAPHPLREPMLEQLLSQAIEVEQVLRKVETAA